MPTKKKYKDYLSRLAYVPIYFEDWYLDACTPPGKWSYVSCELEDGNIGLWPHFIKTKSIFNYITMPHLCKWMGPLTSIDEDMEKRQAIIKKMESKFPEHHHFTQNIFYSACDLEFKDYQIKESFSYSLDLTREKEVIFSKIVADYRNNKIKKAAHLDLILDAPVDDIISMQMASYKYGNFDIPFDETYVRKHVKAIIKKKRGVILSLRDKEDNLYASMFLIWDAKRAYYHLAGMNPELRKSGASIRLIWECIQYAKDILMVEMFDYEGSMIPNLERVRRNFGAEKVYYKNISKTPSKLFGLMKMIKK